VLPGWFWKRLCFCAHSDVVNHKNINKKTLCLLRTARRIGSGKGHLRDVTRPGAIFRTERHAGDGTPKDENGFQTLAVGPHPPPGPLLAKHPNEHAGTGIWFLNVDCSVGEGGGRECHRGGSGKGLCFRGLSEARENINKKTLSPHPACRVLRGKGHLRDAIRPGPCHKGLFSGQNAMKGGHPER